uniref:Uncharacterized protein n=1 Tax=Solanum lycopersicum TaxID=4081 RepID=A0A3Q7IBJ2_SOLLC
MGFTYRPKLLLKRTHASPKFSRILGPKFKLHTLRQVPPAKFFSDEPTPVKSFPAITPLFAVCILIVPLVLVPAIMQCE